MNGALAVTVIVLAAACGGPVGTDRATPDDLRGRSFESIRVERDGADAPLVDDTRINLSFDETGMTWVAGCNHIGGTVTIGPDKLDVIESTVATTDMGCPAPLQQQDEWISTFFVSDPAWELSDGTLTLTSGTTEVVFRAG